MAEGKDLLQVLWSGADVLRGKMDANEYKTYLLGLIFYKYLSDSYLAKVYDLLNDENPDSRIESGHSAMSIEIFMKLVQILDMDANELLSLDALAAEEDRQNKEMICRIRDLKQCEQRVVLHTLDVLVDGLKRCR